MIKEIVHPKILTICIAVARYASDMSSVKFIYNITHFYLLSPNAPYIGLNCRFECTATDKLTK